MNAPAATQMAPATKFTYYYTALVGLFNAYYECLRVEGNHPRPVHQTEIMALKQFQDLAYLAAMTIVNEDSVPGHVGDGIDGGPSIDRLFLSLAFWNGSIQVIRPSQFEIRETILDYSFLRDPQRRIPPDGAFAEQLRKIICQSYQVLDDAGNIDFTAHNELVEDIIDSVNDMAAGTTLNFNRTNLVRMRNANFSFLQLPPGMAAND